MTTILKNGAVFLHVAKTGGRWVESVLSELDLVDKVVAPRHMDVVHYANRVDRINNKPMNRLGNWFSPALSDKPPFMFCFVRNPFDWYESWYKFMSRPDQNWRDWGGQNDLANWHPMSALNGLGDFDFNQFVANVYDKRPGFVSQMYALYTQAPMSFIGKQENLIDDLLKAFKLMNLNVNEEEVRSISKVGVSQPSCTASISWDPELKTKIAFAEYSAFIRYGYENELSNLGLPNDHALMP